MRVRVEQGQSEDARVFTDTDGEVVVTVKDGLLSERARQTMVLALGPLHATQYPQRLR